MGRGARSEERNKSKRGAAEGRKGESARREGGSRTESPFKSSWFIDESHFQ